LRTWKALEMLPGIKQNRCTVSRSLISICIALAALLPRCGSQPPPPPSAVINFAPSQVCEGNEHETTICIGAGESAPRLTLIPVAPSPDDPELTFAWEFVGADVRIVEDEDCDGVDEIAITTAGDRPVHVTLTVTLPGGGTINSVKTIPITPVATGSCDSDEDCAPCAVCDGGSCSPGSPE
jgi:hypothetical protein